MTVPNRLRSLGFRLLAHPRRVAIVRAVAESRRRFMRRPHAVHAFLGLDDPYSYLLACYLGELTAACDVELCVHLAQARHGEQDPHAELRAGYAREDAGRLAAELGLPFLDRGEVQPVELRSALIDALYDPGAPEIEEVVAAISSYWRGDTEAIARSVAGMPAGGRGEAQLREGQALLAKLGHYDTAMLYYGGEWYWGIDRLHHLLDRLGSLGAARAAGEGRALAALRRVRRFTLPVAIPAAARALPPVELFFSFRSPYSYLALQSVFAIADAFGLELSLRPVMPMVLRGVGLTRAKLRYLVTDAAREARSQGIPFGRFADPLGAGVERLMAVFQYARQEKRARDFVQNACEAVWARGIDVATDSGLRRVTGRTGLFWPDVKAALGNEGWRAEVAGNAEAMLEAGCWGVPTMKLGDFVAWGQDRCWLLVRHIEECCDSGEGILI